MTATGADVQDLAIERVDVGKKRSMLSRRVGADRDRQGRHSGARAQHAAAVRSLEDAQRPDLRRGRSRLGSAAVVALARRSSAGGAQRLFDALGCRAAISATAFEAINRATDWTSFTAAIDAFSVPSIEHRLCRRRRQHRLRDVGTAADPRRRRRHACRSTAIPAPAWIGSIEPARCRACSIRRRDSSIRPTTRSIAASAA